MEIAQWFPRILEQGMRLPTLAEYMEMMLPFDGSLDEEQVNQYGLVTSGNTDEFYIVRTSSNSDRYRMMPGPEFSPRLYRGQTKRYPTCKPQLFRNINKKNAKQKYSDLYFWSAKRYELSLLLLHHPALQDIMTWKFKGLAFDLDFQAIAQHYQYQTQMLDLSRNKDVAMFFATHNLAGMKAQPAVGCEAVLYTVDVRAMWASQQNNGHRLVPIGIDPLPRSAAQSAFALEMDLAGDLEQVSGVHAETFIVTEELATSAAENVGGIDCVFPYDPFESAISELRESRTVSHETIKKIVDIGHAPHGMSISDITDIITNGGYHIISRENYQPNEQLVIAAKNEWEMRRSSYISRIKCRPVSGHLILP